MMNSFFRCTMLDLNVADYVQDSSELVVSQRNGSIQIIQLNRAKALNALNLDMIQQLKSHFSQPTSPGLIYWLCGQGRAFCAGGDVKAVVETAQHDPFLAAEFFRQEYQVNHLLGTLSPSTVVAVLDGITMGGGVGLSVHAPIRIATEKTVFAMPETAIGLYPDVGGSFFLPRLDGQLGTYLALTGARLKGADVFLAGISTHYIPSDRIPMAQHYLSSMTKTDPQSVARALHDFCEFPDFDAFELGQPDIRSAIDSSFSHRTVEEIMQALRQDPSAFAQKTLTQLQSMSPTALKITLEQQRRGRSRDFASCFQMEYGLSSRILMANREPGKSSDFFEGVRALLIDKDNRPQWKPSQLQQISDADIDWYFEPVTGMEGARPLKLLNNRTFKQYPHHLGMPSAQELGECLSRSSNRFVDLKESCVGKLAASRKMTTLPVSFMGKIDSFLRAHDSSKSRI